MNTEFIFVYGTLRNDIANSMSHLLTAHCEFFSAGHINGILYEINNYPGVIESGDENDKVIGEIYKITKPEVVIPLLDDYEQCNETFPQPHEYIRKEISVTVAEGQDILAWVYIYNHETCHLEKIDSGDYLSYLNKKL